MPVQVATFNVWTGIRCTGTSLQSAWISIDFFVKPNQQTVELRKVIHTQYSAGKADLPNLECL